MEIKIDPSDRIAPGPKPSNTPILVALAIVMTITGSAGLWAYNKHLDKLAMQERIAEIDRKIEEKNRLEQEAARQKTATSAKRTPHYDEVMRDWEANNPMLERSTVDREPSPKKQTVFNDHNYTPKGAANSVKPPPARYYETGQSRTKIQARQAKVERKEAWWTWESIASGTGGRKRGSSGMFSYLVKNGMIDTSSVCGNETQGSLRYRDCRKGAKDYFAKKCKSGNREACTGSEMIP